VGLHGYLQDLFCANLKGKLGEELFAEKPIKIKKPLFEDHFQNYNQDNLKERVIEFG